MALYAKAVQNPTIKLKPSFAYVSRPQGPTLDVDCVGLAFFMPINATFRSIYQDGYLPKTFLATAHQFGDNQTARCTDFLCFLAIRG
jgi:hypothetical protein